MFNSVCVLAKVHAYPATRIPTRRRIRVQNQRPVDVRGASLDLLSQISQAKAARPQRGRIILAQRDRATRQPHGVRDLTLAINHPAMAVPERAGPRRHSVGRGVIAVEFRRAHEEPHRFQEAVSIVQMKTGHSAQEVVVSVEALGRLPSRTLDLRALEPWLNGTHHPCGYLVLQLKYILQGTIEAVRPNVSAGCRIDELPGEPYAISCLAHTPLEHVTHPEFARDLFHVDGPALVSEAGVPRDDKQRPTARQRRDDFIGHAIGEVLLFRVRADVLKRQNGNGWPVRKRGVRGTGKIGGTRHSGEGTLVPDAGRAEEPVASSGHSLDPILAARLLPKHPT